MDITVKPLRKVTEDIQPVAEFYLAQYAKEHNEPPKHLDQSAVKALKKHDWPGNIRELKNVILLAVGNVDSNLITSSDLSISRSSPDIPETMRLRDPKVEKQRIADALTRDQRQYHTGRQTVGNKPYYIDLQDKTVRAEIRP